ncbi:MAG: RNA methyltransferase [Parvularculaceae bacterium]
MSDGDHGEAAEAPRGGIDDLGPGPAFVLVDPQLGENIGATARAMLNFGLADLRIANPRDGWPNERAVAMASGAVGVEDRAPLHDNAAAALADVEFALATTARRREMLLPVFDPAEAAAEFARRIERGQKCAAVFGPERRGLSNEDVLRCDGGVSIPVNPAFPSLNLAQAALVVGYEWAKAAGLAGQPGDLDDATPAPKADFERLVAHLFEALDAADYFHPPEKRASKERSLRVSLMRAGLTEGEARAWRGVIKALTRRRGGGDD